MTKVRQGEEVPIGIWLVTIAGLALILMVAGYLRRGVHPEQGPWARFDVKRLKRIKENGHVAVGTSLIRCGFPFDDRLEDLAAERGMTLQFVRFSTSGNDLRPLEVLAGPILSSNPRRVFLQVEPLFCGFDRRSGWFDRRSGWFDRVISRFGREWISLVQGDVYFLFAHLILGRSFSIHPNRIAAGDQGDRRLKLHHVATAEDVKHVPLRVRTNVLSARFEKFVCDAKDRGIEVIFLEIGRSKEANALLPEKFKRSWPQVLKQASETYDVPLWRFRDDLSIDHYYDRAHLNGKGRAVFTEWFLSKLADEDRE